MLGRASSLLTIYRITLKSMLPPLGLVDAYPFNVEHQSPWKLQNSAIFLLFDICGKATTFKQTTKQILRIAVLIHIEKLEKYYGQTKVLSNISLQIERGEIFAIVGHSGAGKSTLLRCINGLEPYSGGSLQVQDKEVQQLKATDLRQFRRNIGMIFQHFSLMQRKTVYENVLLPLELWKYPPVESRKKVQDLLEMVGLADKKKSFPGELSGGQKQRVAIARALTLEPDILLSDEATSALDPGTTNSILELLDTINRKMGITIVLVTHEMGVVKAIAHRATLLSRGEIIATGAVEDLFLQPTKEMRSFLGEEDTLPDTGVNIRLVFSKKTSSQPFVAQMARTVDVDFNIVWGKMEKIRDGVIGNLVINMDRNDCARITSYLQEQSIHWEEL